MLSHSSHGSFFVLLCFACSSLALCEYQTFRVPGSPVDLSKGHAAKFEEEVKPHFTTDFTGLQWSPTKAQQMYILAVLATVVLIIGIYSNRGTRVCSIIVVFVLSLSAMSVLIRNLYVTHKFSFPLWVTASHFLSTFVVGLAVLLYRSIWAKDKSVGLPSLTTITRGIFPAGLAFAGSIGLANTGLLYTNAHFYEMNGSLSPLVTVALGVLMGRGFKWQLLGSLMLVTLGLLLVSFGEVHFNLLGWICILSSTVLRAVRVQLHSMLLSGNDDFDKLDPMELIVWSSGVSFSVMIAWSYLKEGFMPYEQALDLKTFWALFTPMVNGAFLNIAGVFVLRELGPVGQQVVGNLKSVLSCLAATALFGEVISPQQALGYCVLIVGTAWYNKTDMMLKEDLQNKFQEKKQSSEASALLGGVKKI